VPEISNTIESGTILANVGCVFIRYMSNVLIHYHVICLYESYGRVCELVLAITYRFRLDNVS